MASTHSKNIRQDGSFNSPNRGENKEYLHNHHLPGTQMTPVLIGVWAFFWRVEAPKYRTNRFHLLIKCTFACSDKVCSSIHPRSWQRLRSSEICCGFSQEKNSIHTVDGRHPANQLIWEKSHYLQYKVLNCGAGFFPSTVLW